MNEGRFRPTNIEPTNLEITDLTLFRSDLNPPMTGVEPQEPTGEKGPPPRKLPALGLGAFLFMGSVRGSERE
jgi:hypothetical protein